MKLTRKLISAIVVAIFAVMTADALLELRREIALFEDDMAQDEHAMGQAERAALEAVAASGGADAARAAVDRSETLQKRVGLRWIWLDDAPNVPAEVRERLARGEEVRTVRDDPHAGERQFTYEPLSIAGSWKAALELSEPLQPQRTFLRRTEFQVLATLVVMVGVCAVLSLFLGIAFIGRPVGALAAQARRIAAGDLSQRLSISQRDEIGSLAAEFNTMCDHLAESQERVREETDARISTLEQLRHADRLKTVGQLASGIAHELGTPLNVVGGRAKLIVGGALSPGDVIASARTIVDQSDRMAAIIRQLLDFARRRGARSTVADLRDIVSRTVEMLAVLARSRRVDLDLTLPATPLPLRADPNQLQQALANVVVNGVQALPDGGRVRVTAGPYNGTTKHWSVVIEDDGVGISEQNLPRLFEPFFTTKGVGEGTGLGLAVAHGIVAEHGGWIDVSSAPGRGSRFEIVLEAEPEPARHAEAV